MMDSNDYLFTRCFMQAAYISLLEELKDQVERDIQILRTTNLSKDTLAVIDSMQQKIDIANNAIKKLKKDF